MPREREDVGSVLAAAIHVNPCSKVFMMKLYIWPFLGLSGAFRPKPISLNAASLLNIFALSLKDNFKYGLSKFWPQVIGYGMMLQDLH